MALYVGEGSEREQFHLLGSCPISSHFPHFLYVTGTLLVATLVWNPRVGGFTYVLGPCRSFKTDSPERLAVSSTTPTPAGFCSQKLRRLYFPVLEPWAVWSGLGLGLLAPQVSLLVLSTTLEYGAALSAGHHCCLAAAPSLPLLPVWINISSLNPWLSDFHAVRFSGSPDLFLF